MEAKSTARYIRISSRKTRLVADNIKGKSIEDAINILKFTPKRSAEVLSKVLHSAIANAEQTPGMNVDALYVKSVIVDGGPMWKRIMTRSMGRAYRIKKRTSHITVIVDELS